MKRIIAFLTAAALMLCSAAFAETEAPAVTEAPAATEVPAAAEIPAPSATLAPSAEAETVPAGEADILTAEPDLQAVEPEQGTDTTYLVVETAGMLETVAQSRFTEERLGFTFLFDSEYLSVYNTLSEDGASGAIYVNPSDPENTLPISLQIIPASILGVDADAFLNRIPMSFELDDIGQMDQIVMDSGTCFSFRAGFKGDMYYMFFTLTGGKTDLCLLARYPLDVIESYGARFDRLIWSTEFIKSNP